MKTISLTIAVLIFLSVQSQARILNVPEDFELIQAAIDASEDGDTILVARGGNYRGGGRQGGLNFNGKAITVASNFIITGDPMDIDSTIIRGGGSVVRFDHGEDENSRLIGLTLKEGANGSPDLDNDWAGGGIHCRDSSPYLAFLKIMECWADYGGGIFLQRSSPTITDCWITRNSSWGGGALNCSREGTNPVIIRTVMHGNYRPDWNFSQIDCFSGTRPVFINCTITVSWNDCDIIRLYDNNYVKFINCACIMTDFRRIVGRGHDTLEVNWSCAEISRNDEIEEFGNESAIIWGEGNIAEVPEFVDWEEGNLTPRWGNYPEDDDTKSNLIDVGNPELPGDPDGTRADIGAISFGQGGWITGSVRNAASGEVISGAIVSGPNGIRDTTDEEGGYELHNLPQFPIILTVSALEYADTTLDPVEVAPHETLNLDVDLLGGILECPEEIFTSIHEGDSTQIAFSVENSGNGSLSFTAEARPEGDASFPPGKLRQRQEIVGLENIRPGIPILMNGEYYMPGQDINEQNFVYVLDIDYRLVRSFRQPQIARNSLFKSLAWDGARFWGNSGGDHAIVAFSSQGDSITTIFANNPPLYLTYDPNDSLLWYSSNDGSFYSIDPATRQVTDSVEFDFSNRGFAYRADDPDGYELYCRAGFNFSSTTYLIKFDLETGDTMTIAKWDTSATSLGMSLSNNFDRYGSLVAFSGSRQGANNFLDIVQIEPNFSWAILTPIEGSIPAGESFDFTLNLSAANFTENLYPGEIHFYHTGQGLHSVVPFELEVTLRPVDTLSVGSSLALANFRLYPSYPSPFNSSTTISFSLPGFGEAGLRVYDLQGRLVKELVNGRLEAGEHKVVWEAGNMGSGVYVVKLEGAGKAVSRKIVLMR